MFRSWWKIHALYRSALFYLRSSMTPAQLACAAELDRIEAQRAAAMQLPDANAQQIELAAVKRMAIAYKALKESTQ